MKIAIYQTMLPPLRHKAFTLIELLIAMAISALILVLLVVGLKTVIHNYQALSLSQKNFSQLQYAMTDLNRSILNLTKITGNSQAVELLTAQQTLTHQAYLVDSDGNLIKRNFIALDDNHNDQYQDTILLRQVNHFQCHYLNENNILIDAWPPNNTSIPYPKALIVTLDIPSLGTMTHTFLIQRGIAQ